MKELNEAKLLLEQAAALISAQPCANNSQLVVRYGIGRDLGNVRERLERFRELCAKDPMPEGIESGESQLKISSGESGSIILGSGKAGAIFPGGALHIEGTTAATSGVEGTVPARELK